MSTRLLESTAQTLIGELEKLLANSTTGSKTIDYLLKCLKDKPEVMWLTKIDGEIYLEYNLTQLALIHPNRKAFDRSLKHIRPWMPKLVQTGAEVKIWRFEYVQPANKKAKVECAYCGGLYVSDTSLKCHVTKHCPVIFSSE